MFWFPYNGFECNKVKDNSLALMVWFVWLRAVASSLPPTNVVLSLASCVVDFRNVLWVFSDLYVRGGGSEKSPQTGLLWKHVRYVTEETNAFITHDPSGRHIYLLISQCHPVVAG